MTTDFCPHCHKVDSFVLFDVHRAAGKGDEGFLTWICTACSQLLYDPPAEPLKEPVGPLTTRRTSYSSLKMRHRVYGEGVCLNPACRVSYVKRSPISQTCGDPVCARWQRTNYERTQRAARVRAQ